MTRDEETCKGPWATNVSFKGSSCLKRAAVRAWPSRRLADADMPELGMQEDTLLKRLIAQHGTANWSLIAKFVPGRSGKSCEFSLSFVRPGLFCAVPH